MNLSNLLRRLLGGFLVISIVSLITFSSCTEVNYDLGNDLTLDNQGLKLGQLKFVGATQNGNNYFETRLYKNDSISTANMSYGYLGTQKNDTFGIRQAGFFTQYLPGNTLDEDVFGYMPIFDSVVLYISVESYGGDTSVVQNFEIYEVVDNSFLYNTADSMIFGATFDMEPFLAAEPIFTFKFPDQDNEIYMDATTVTLAETTQTMDFMDRLMLQTIYGDYDYEIYNDEEEEWVDVFKGFYICPAKSEALSSGNAPSAAMFKVPISGSGFIFYGRSREEDDPTLILDTIGMTYPFYTTDADAGNVMINCVRHDYDGSLINIDDVKTAGKSNDEVPQTSVIRVEGMTGVVSEITLAKEIFEQLDTILEQEEAETGEVFTSIFFNQAMLKIYMEQVSSYDFNDLDPYTVTPWMNYMPTNLGLYTNYSYYLLEYEDYEDEYYSSLIPVADYVYSYETSYTLDFDGALNRSWGCYVMNIAAYMQYVWLDYLEAKEAAQAAGTEINWDDVSDRTVYLGPIASDLFSLQYASLQAGDPTLNSVPMTLELTYTMIR